MHMHAICMYECMYVCMHVCMENYVCMYVCCVYVCVSVCVCVCVCVRAFMTFVQVDNELKVLKIKTAHEELFLLLLIS